ncbi:restriction endonuclease subunit S [Flavobacterium sp. GT2N3]|uniref:restriction endonuclease subunit S n=1 Tax=unclassified Flavobacterium TaxID=196869 RepID=UPI003AAED250
MRIDDLFHFEKGSLQSSKCTAGEFDFITASSEWKTHNEYTHNCEALIFAAAASGSLGRTHYVNGKFISSDLCFIITAKDPKNLPIDLKFYHMIFNEFKDDIVKNTKAGTSKEAIGLKAFGNYKLPYFEIDKQIETKVQFVNMQYSKVELNSELTHQLDLIKQLRQAFLREAMQGKLIKSTNTNETGQQLLAKIKAEKAKLIAEKKLKKEKEFPPINEEEIPFEIPEHWVWCRLGEVTTQIFDGPFGSHLKTADYTNSGVQVIRLGNLGEMSFKYEKESFISEEKYETIKQHTIYEGDLIIGSFLADGVKCIALPQLKYKAIAKADCFTIRIRHEMLSNKFVMFLLSSSPMFIELSKLLRGMTRLRINTTQLKQLPVPLPPLHEQEQIVAKLEGLMAFCDGLEQSIKESQRYNEMLLQQVLREALQPKEETKKITLESRKIEQPLKTILAGHIINLNNTTDFGRVKFQKLLYLTEYCCKIDFDSNYIKKAAGPYDDELIKKIEVDFARLRFYNVVQDKTETKRVRYTALPGAKEMENLFLENYPDESLKINNLLMNLRPLSWRECEVVATIYAVWNNRIIKSEPVTDDLLYNDFMAWDAQKIKYKDIFYKKLFWMKEENIIADGWGKYVDKPNIKMS